MLKEFKEFATKGNVVDMAVGIVVGAAFGAIVAVVATSSYRPSGFCSARSICQPVRPQGGAAASRTLWLRPWQERDPHQVFINDHRF
jgi:hypothetical protein